MMPASSATSVVEEALGLLDILVAFPTESRSTNLELIDFVAEVVVAAGGAARVIPGAAGRANLLARFGPEAPGGIVWSGHTDVVPAGSGWATDPYTVTVDGDRLIGRGTADMKGFIACALAVAVRLDVSRWTAPLLLGLSYDEEIGCVGVGSLLDVMSGDPTIAPEVVVVGEPTGLTLRTFHPGKVAYTMQARCSSAHSSLSTSRTSALAELATLATTVFAANRFGADAGASTNVGTLHGGIAVNVLAPSAELTFECRHQADRDPDSVLSEVWAQVERSREALAGLGGSLDVAVDARYPALATDASHPSVQRVAEAVGGLPSGGLDFGSEAGMYSTALEAPSVVFGPGNISDAHCPGEFVLRSDLDATCRSLESLAATFCGGVRDQPISRPGSGTSLNEKEGAWQPNE